MIGPRQPKKAHIFHTPSAPKKPTSCPTKTTEDQDSNVVTHHPPQKNATDNSSIPMALHLFHPHSSKPPPPSLPKTPILIKLNPYGAFHMFQCQTNIPNWLKVRALPPAAAQSSKQEPNFFSLSTPPSSREEAISQAKTCLAATLQRYLKTQVNFQTKKLKRQKQLRYRVEIPVIDDSPSSVVQLGFEVFSDLNIRRKDLKLTILMVWPSLALEEMANQNFTKSRHSNTVIINSKLGSTTTLELLNSSDLAVILTPEETQLGEIMMLVDELDPKPVIMFNPKWAFEDENNFNKKASSFIKSFDVVYSFAGLEVQGILSRRRGVVLRCARDGKASGEPWLVMVEGGDDGEEMKVVTRFAKRPSIVEVEAVLYNLMAANSPLTKSVKSVSDFVRNVTKKFT